MTVDLSSPTRPTDLTPISSKLPAWLINAPAATHAALRKVDVQTLPWLSGARETDAQTLEQLQKVYVRHRRHEQRIQQVLAALPAIETYAEPLLKAKLQERFGLDVDVRNSYLFHARRVVFDGSFLTVSQDPAVKAGAAIKAATQSLLACALQNFEAWEAVPGAMTDDRGRTSIASRIYYSDPALNRPGRYPDESPLNIVPEQFAALCRELDLGGTYQQLIQRVLNPVSAAGDAADATSANLRADFKQLEQSTFLLHTHIARLKKTISPQMHGVLVDIARNKPATLEGVAVTRNFLKLWDVELSAIVVFGKDRSASQHSEKVVVYIPDDPYDPLREYPSLAHFFASLRDSFLKPDYQQFFARFVPARQRAQLFARLRQAFYPKVWNSAAGYFEEKLDRNASLHLREGTFFGNLLNALYQQKIAQLKDDALFHGVPTAAEDHKSLQDKLLYFVQTTFNVLNIAAFVVPVLGEVMLAVTAVQLCNEVYEGIESLAKGESQQAWGYLMDVVENLAMIAALGGLSAAGGGAVVQAPELVRQMHTVQLADGSTRLWKPDLQPFAHDLRLPAGLKPNVSGLYDYQGRQWLVLEGRTYTVKPPAGSAPYRLEHPWRMGAYEPPLRHNQAGAWLQITDQPLEWEGIRLFRRLGHVGAEFSDEVASTIMRVSETHQAQLRHALSEGLRPPALFTDTLQRFQLEQDLDHFSRQLQAQDPGADPALQLQLLTEAPGWPNSRALTVLDEQGKVLAQYHSQSGNALSRPLQVQLDGGDALEALMRQMSKAELEGLLQHPLGSGEPNFTTAKRQLQQQLATEVKTHKPRLFNERYQALQKTDAGPVLQIQQAFSGLPTVVVEELLRHATPAELEQLHVTARVPIRLGEEARAYQHKLRLNRAYEGLYLDAGSSPDSERLVLHTLSTLHGWPTDLRLKVREGSIQGALLDSIGSSEASIGNVLVSDGTTYRTYDADGRQLHGRDNLYAAVLHALPDAQRSALGFADVSQHAALKQAVQAQPLLPRHSLRAVLKMQALKPGARSPMRLADGRLGFPLSGRGRLAGFILEETLLDKIRLLEFEHAFPEQILQMFYDAQWSRADIDQRLDQLLAEQQSLRNHLSNWTDAASSMPPLSAARMNSRTRIAEALWRHWRANNLPELSQATTPLQLADVYLSDFPAQLPDFIQQRVQGLELWNVNHDETPINPFITLDNERNGLGRFFGRFPQVRSLVYGQSLGQSSYPFVGQIVLEHYPQLRELSLIDTRLYIGQAEINLYRGFSQLQRLDLSGNTLNILGNIDLSGLNLQYLGLNRTNLRGWPQWLDSANLNAIAEVSLADNQITTVPAAVLENPIGSGHHTRVSLRNNELSRDTLIRMRLSEGEGRRFSFELTIAENLRTILDVMTQERAALDEAFVQWAEASHSGAPLRDEQIASRRRLGRLVHDLWSHEPTHGHVGALRLEAIALNDFPRRLPAFFYHRLRRLQLLRVGTHASELHQFLSDFPYLDSLHIEGHVTPLGSLNAAVPQLRMLEHLSLIDLGLNIDQSALATLQLMPGLTELQLDGNVIGEISDASALRNIEQLSLNNVGLQAWPQWLDTLLPGPMQRLSLAGNQIRELPERILANPRTEVHHTEISLTGNPLSDETMRTAYLSEGYNRAYDFYMDLPPDILALERARHYSSGSSPSSPEETESGVDVWLSGAEDRSTIRRGIWQQIEDGADASDLLGVISHLEHSADYRDASSRSGLTERVWGVLEVAANDTELRLVLNGMGAEPLQQIRQRDTCPDGIRLAFNQMEIQVFIRQSLQGVAAEQRGSSLYALTRRLYRLEALDNAAREQAGSRDEAEVRLAYRLQWAREMDLPVPPSNMLYRTAANIRPAELDAALNLVRQGEGGQAFLDFARGRDFWVDYLRESHADRFMALKSAYEAEVLDLYDLYPDDNPEQIAARITVLEQQFKRNESNLIEALTNLAGQQQR
ncbi:NEL-type E3 ubiquitin ligase domain-containing protein [Pseudomonas sp. 2835]|uniref:NEL-type E3 ubiquitin ligase domain-containing protein n=1 Tax=Pseudomonas sp. 2835 TaxID=3156451 RepID=UPI003D1A65AA